MITYKFILKDTVDLNVKVIKLRITANRKTAFISTNIKIDAKSWDNNKMIIKGRSKGNLIINNYKSKLEKLILINELENRNFTINSIKDFLKNKEIKSFNEFMNEDLKNYNLAYDTLRTYKSQISKINDFQEFISFSEIDLNFLERYKRYRQGFGITDNTLTKDLSVLRTFINRARLKGYIKQNPFEYFKIKGYTAKTTFLSIEDLQVLNRLYDSETLKDNLQNVLHYFLFACYTGLRFSDIRALRWRNVYDNSINITMHKTKLAVSVPLSVRAAALLPVAAGPDNRVFNVLVNQTTNRYLKEIQKFTDIETNISFHISRHTFATVAVSLNVPIEVVSKLLGHTSIKQTMNYAKILKDVKIKEISKFDTI